MTSRGRILRIKRGYNPNSSSVGSGIPIFLFASTALVVVSAIAAQIHTLIKTQFARSKEKSPTEVPEERARGR